MKSALVVFLSLVGLSSVSLAAGVAVHCEGEASLISFNMTSTSVVEDYVYVNKATPDTKLEIKTPASLGSGVFDVNAPTNKDGESSLQLPPYAAQDDVTQFAAVYGSDVTYGTGTTYYEEDIFCHKN